MIEKVKVIGAGSIGNHLSHAARRMGWKVDLCDVDPNALERSKREIYPSRYGAWDEGISLFTSSEVPRGGYDLIVIGTPPDSHMSLAMEALDEEPKALLIEKPLCTPLLEMTQAFFLKSSKSKTKVFSGYDHVVGAASERVLSLVQSPGLLGRVETMDVEFREHWSGIFAAHPWLSGPADTYLGYWKRGGGACGEHSHALNLWQTFAHALGLGRVKHVSATIDYVRAGEVLYDKLALMTLKTELGVVGRVVQDVVTRPPRKWARIQGAEGHVEWHCGYQPGVDAVFTGQSHQAELFHKTRPDDFIRELEHIKSALEAGRPSPLALDRGLDTMLVVAAAHMSAELGQTVEIDYSKGYCLDALSPLILK